MPRLRAAAVAIIAISICVAIWVLLLAAGVKAFPADSFLSLPFYLARQIEITPPMTAIAAANGAIVLLASRLKSQGLWIALAGATLLLLATGADMLSSRDLAGPLSGEDHDHHHLQSLFWYRTVGAMLYAALGCFLIGWALWLRAVLTAWLERRESA